MTTQRALREALEVYAGLADDPRQLPSFLASREVDRCRVACWQAGECCGDPGVVSGECHCVSVRIERRSKLIKAGMGPAAANAMMALCERGDQWQLVQSAHAFAKEQGIPLSQLTSALAGVEISEEAVFE